MGGSIFWVPSMFKIHIRDLLCRCIVGIFPDEREKPQDVVVNVELTCELSAAAKSDNIDDTVDYKALNKAIIALVESSSFYLLEALAQRILVVCLEDPKVKCATVSVDKPGALRFARSVAVEVSGGTN